MHSSVIVRRGLARNARNTHAQAKARMHTANGNIHMRMNVHTGNSSNINNNTRNNRNKNSTATSTNDTSQPWTLLRMVSSTVARNSSIQKDVVSITATGLSTHPARIHNHVNGKNLSSMAEVWNDDAEEDHDDNYETDGTFNYERNSNINSNSTIHINSHSTIHNNSNKKPRSEEKHCDTCTCPDHKQAFPPPLIVEMHHCGATVNNNNHTRNNNHNNNTNYDEIDNMPPPLEEPKYSVYKRVMPSSCTALSSRYGRQRLMEALMGGQAESYWALSEHFINQSDPAFCGVTTLVMVLNSMCVDPNVRWRGGWRFYGDENFLLDRCCLHPEKVRRAGITVEEFALLAKCQGLNVTISRPNVGQPAQQDPHQQREDYQQELDRLRSDVLRMVHAPPSPTTTTNDTNNASSAIGGGSILVVSFARSVLGQTGEGHFSPIAAYHKGTDSVLVMDVARFKYAPYWVSLEELYQAMLPLDASTKRPRGWFCLDPPTYCTTKSSSNTHQIRMDEQRRPAELVPPVGQGMDICPVGEIKVEYCKANSNNLKNDNGRVAV